MGQFLVVDGKVVKRYESITEPAAIAKDIEARERLRHMSSEGH